MSRSNSGAMSEHPYWDNHGKKYPLLSSILIRPGIEPGAFAFWYTNQTYRQRMSKFTLK